jgi:hypothetical protein
MVLLEAAFLKFKASKYYAQMVKIIGNSQIHNKTAEQKVKRIIQKVLNASYVLHTTAVLDVDDYAPMDIEERVKPVSSESGFLSDSERMRKQTEVIHRNARLFVSRYGRGRRE